MAEVKKEKKKKRTVALTTITIACIGTTANRVRIKTKAPEVAGYLEQHEVYIESTKGNKTRMGIHGFNAKKRKDKQFDETIIERDRVPAFIRQLRRVADQIEGHRTLDSLATEMQLKRVKQFYEILSRRKDNTLFEPIEIDMFTHGEIGRLRSDLESVLVGEGLWDPINKVETEKATKLK
jgi:hypothetical protein